MEPGSYDPRAIPISLRRELLAEGYTDRGLARALRDGVFARARRGAYVNGDEWTRLTREEKYVVFVRAAYAQSKTAVMLSHVSALPFLGAPLWGLDLEECHLTRMDERTGRREAGVCQHSGRLLDGDTSTSFGYRHSSAVRAAFEVMTVAPTEQSLVVVCHLLNTKAVTDEELRKRNDAAMEKWPHSLHTDVVLRLADARIESPGEARTLYAMWRQRLPRPVPQYEVTDDNGSVVARLDFALPEHGVWLEFDGRVKYGRFLRQGEDVTDAVLREKRREELIVELTGWRCIRITWSDLDDPVRLADRIRDVIARVAAGRRRTAG